MPLKQIYHLDVSLNQLSSFDLSYIANSLSGLINISCNKLDRILWPDSITSDQIHVWGNLLGDGFLGYSNSFNCLLRKIDTANCDYVDIYIKSNNIAQQEKAGYLMGKYYDTNNCYTTSITDFKKVWTNAGNEAANLRILQFDDKGNEVVYNGTK